MKENPTTPDLLSEDEAREQYAQYLERLADKDAIFGVWRNQREMSPRIALASDVRSKKPYTQTLVQDWIRRQEEEPTAIRGNEPESSAPAQMFLKPLERLEKLRKKIRKMFGIK